MDLFWANFSGGFLILLNYHPGRHKGGHRRVLGARQTGRLDPFPHHETGQHGRVSSQAFQGCCRHHSISLFPTRISSSKFPFQQARLRQRCSNSSKASELESAFFDCEVEDGGVCRDLVSTTHQDEVSYLQDVTELLLFLLLPQVIDNYAKFG